MFGNKNSNYTGTCYYYNLLCRVWAYEVDATGNGISLGPSITSHISRSGLRHTPLRQWSLSPLIWIDFMAPSPRSLRFLLLLCRFLFWNSTMLYGEFWRSFEERKLTSCQEFCRDLWEAVWVTFHAPSPLRLSGNHILGLCSLGEGQAAWFQLWFFSYS
jgi:hypothetical protein